MPEIDRLELDRHIARGARAHRFWRGQLGEGQPDAACPLGSSLAAQRKTLKELSGLDDAWLGDPLRRWVLHLVLERACAPETTAVEHEFRIRRHPISEPVRCELPLAELLERALCHAAETDVWLSHYLRAAHSLASASSALWERRAELADELERDCPNTPEPGRTESDQLAESFLADSADAYGSLAPRELGELLVTAQGNAASDGWPGRLTPRTVVGLVQEPALLRGLRLELGRVPRALGPASYLRALTVFGWAWSEASAPSQMPFVLTHDPYHLREHTYGAVFGLVPLLPEFIKTRLGLSRSRARDHVRALAGAVLVEARAVALRALLRAPALRGQRWFGEAFEHWTSQTFGFRLDAHLAGAIFRPRFDDAQRLAGLFLAASLQHRFVETHDEDWFRNPRAIDELRTLASAAGTATVPPELSAQGAQDLLASLHERL